MKPLFYLIALFLFISCREEHDLFPSPGRMIKEFKLETGQYGNENIYWKEDQYKVLVKVQPGTDLKNLKPIIKLSEGATISPASGETVNASSNPIVIYTVTAPSGQTRQWEVEFRIFESIIKDYSTYSISNSFNNNAMEVKGDLLFNEKYLNDARIGAGAAQVANGENLVRWQEWHIIHHSTVNGVTYYQIRNLHSGKLLNAPGAGVGLEITQSTELKTDVDRQLWKIEESIEAGKYEITNKANSLYLTLEGTEGSNFKVVQADKLDSDKQKWLISNLQQDSYRDDEVVNFFNRTTGSVAFDQGNSIPLADGRVLWVTQDAYYQGSLAPNGRLYGNHFISYANSIIIQPSINNWSPDAPMMTADGAFQNIGNICPKQPDTEWSWPGPGVQIDDKVYLHCGEGKGLGSTNQSLYELTQVSGNKWKADRTTPAGMSGQTEIGYATGMVKASDGFVYCFGSRGAPGSFGYESFLHVARFPVSNPQNWTFWNGSSWVNTPSIAPSAQINKGLGTNSVSYLNGKYIHLTMDQGFYCDIPSINMYISTSSSPTGPFTPKKLVYRFTENYKGYNAKIYTPSLHTESVNGKNELLLTYSINFGACSGQNDPLKETDGNLDPYYYRVKGVRVPYEMFE